MAVKLQYPGAGPALLADFTQLSRLAWLFARISPGLEVKPLLAELKERVLEELDYTLEAESQRAFAAAYAGDADIAVPRVVASAPKVIVTEWMDGKPLSRIIADGTECRAGPRRRAAGAAALLRAGARRGCCTPTRTRATSGSLPTAGSASSTSARWRTCPRRTPTPLGRLTRLALDGDADALVAMLREHGFIRAGVELDPARVMEYFDPVLDPLRGETFTFSREWMRRQAARISDPRSEEALVGRMLNLPPTYLLIHRVTIGSIGILCQLGCDRRVPTPRRALAAGIRR